jgi:hypothetical protein
MKHKLYESWILDDSTLNKTEQQLLREHLKTCQQCQKLKTAWLESRNRIKSASIYQPQLGFRQRWLTMLSKRREFEKTRQVRRTLFILILIMGMAFLGYMLQNNLLVTWIVSAISLIASLFINMTKALAGIGELLSDTPALVYGFSFLSLGAIAALIASSAFILWNILKKGSQKHAYDVED